MNNNYSDIINLPHHISKKHPQMTIEERAAQFGAFSPLTGYDDAVEETARLTDKRIELNDEEIEILNKKIQIIKSKIKDIPKVSITYFVPDSKKQGGEYVEVTGRVKKIDEYSQKIILENGCKINISEILQIIY